MTRRGTHRLGLFLTLALGASLAGCRAVHAELIESRLVEHRFFEHDVAMSLGDVDRVLTGLRTERLRWCELCTLSAQWVGDARQYCLTSHHELACLEARAVAGNHTRFRVPTAQATSDSVIRALWWTLEPSVARLSERPDDAELDALAEEEEEAFVPRWSFIAGAKVGTVISADPTAYTFGGQVGVRYWGSLFVIPGVVFEAENALQRDRSVVGLSVQGRIELSVWRADNARFFNAPSISFVMSGGPLVGVGYGAGLGGRASVGVHIIHLSQLPTPVFLELGFQALTVDEKGLTGLRLALGIGL